MMALQYQPGMTAGHRAINLNHPLMRGCCFALMPVVNGPFSIDSWRNQVGLLEKPTRTGTGLTVAQAFGPQRGRCMANTTGGASYLNYGTTANRWGTSNKVSGVVVYRPLSVSGDRRILVENNGGGTYPFLLRTNGTSLELYSNNIGSGTVISAASSMAINTTYCMGFTIGSVNGGKLYINGVQKASTTFSGTISTTINLGVGVDLSATSVPMYGILESVLLFNRELSGGEHWAHYVEWQKGRKATVFNRTVNRWTINSASSAKKTPWHLFAGTM